jgi:ABC-type nitrate/sulfonate/bicarbonate transport system substrate-binding protein
MPLTRFEIVKLALGLRSTAQSLALVGLAAGTFREAGIDLRIERMETAGPAGIKGLVEGDWQIAEFGAVPVAQWALAGKDVAILLAAEPVSALYILGAKSMLTPASLAGGRIGVLSRAGQTGYSALEMMKRWGLPDLIELAELGRYPVIFQEVQAGRIAGGVLTADYRFAASESDDLPVLADLGREFAFQGPVLATTRAFIAEHEDTVARVVRGYSAAVHVFKTRSDIVLPVLKRHLPFASPESIRRIHAFYAGRFSRIPRPSVEGIQAVIDSLRRARPETRNMAAAELYAGQFIDDLEQQGFFDALYGEARMHVPKD